MESVSGPKLSPFAGGRKELKPVLIAVCRPQTGFGFSHVNYMLSHVALLFRPQSGLFRHPLFLFLLYCEDKISYNYFDEARRRPN